MAEMAPAISDAETSDEDIFIFFHVQYVVQSIRIGR
jgi:hypothetical protein